MHSIILILFGALLTTAYSQGIPFGPQTQSNIIVNTLFTLDGETLLVENGVLNAVGQWTLVESAQGVFTFSNLPPILDNDGNVVLTPATLACQGGGILGFLKNETTGEGLLSCGSIGDIGFSNYEWGQSEFNPPATNPLVMGPLDGLAYFEGMAVATPDSSEPVDITTIGSPLGAVVPVLLRWLGTAD